MKAIWNNTVSAEPDATILLDWNHYFSFDSIKSFSMKALYSLW